MRPLHLTSCFSLIRRVLSAFPHAMLWPPNRKIRLALCSFQITGLGVIDFISGWQLGFFVFYFLPISLATWGVGMRAGFAMAFYSALVWLTADALLETHYTSWLFMYWNALIRLVADLVLVLLLGKIKHLHATQTQTLNDLLDANRQIKVLRGIFPICASCKNIRNDRGYWEQIENYISKHSHAEFTHGICEDCMARLYPEYWKRLAQEGPKSGANRA